MKKVLFPFLTFLILSATYAQNVGIGTTAPVSKLTIHTPNNTDGLTHVSDGGIVLTDHIGGVSASIGTSSYHAFRLMANNNPLINLDVLGNVGIGLTDQAYKMDISDRIRIRSGSGPSTAGIWLNSPDNSIVHSFVGVKDASTVGFYGNPVGWSFVMNTNNGNVGIGGPAVNPVNKLQIGEMGTTGYSGNDFALGNGTNGMAIWQTNQYTLVGASTNIVFFPTSQRVGINTYVPRAPLEVDGSADQDATTYSYLGPLSTFYGVGNCQSNTCTAHASIYASNAVYAQEFDAYSDARIKNIQGISNSAKDLQTVDALQITDYRMKDVVKYGERDFKKVIAQEVEKVYPQVVSRHADFVPNVYQAAVKVTKVAGGLLLSFTNNHSISSGAKKLQVLMSDKRAMEGVNIVSIPSATQVIIDAANSKVDKVFVYGEEVDDFRTVDYEGLTTLNISATQELSKLVKKQQAAIEAQSLQIAALTQAVRLLKERGCAEVQ